MKNAQRVTEQIPMANPTDEFTHIEVDLFFSRGGVNYLSGNQNPKGYAISFRAVKVEKTQWGSSTSFMMFGGWDRAFLLQNATRFNAKALAMLKAALDFTKLAALFETKDYDKLRESLRTLSLA